MTFKVKDGLDIAGVIFADGNRNVVASNVTATSAIITNTTGTNSTSTGALIVQGGAGIAGGVYVGSTSTFTGSLSVGQTLNVTGNTYIGGDLYVDGTQFFINKTNIESGDATVALSTASISAAAAANSGILIGSTTTPYASWLYDGSANWVSSGTNAGGVKVLSTASSTNTASGALQVIGGAGIGGNIWVGGNILPGSALSTLGTLANPFKSLYVSSTTISVGNVALSSDNVNNLIAPGLIINSSTVATNTGTGALQVQGGVGVWQNLYVGGVGYFGPTQGLVGLTNPLIVATSNVNSYTQIQIQNTSSGSIASSDFIATANNGTDGSNYIDMGINNSGWNTSTWTISGANDGYLYVDGGNLTLGTDTPNKNVYIHVGGTTLTNIVASFYAANTNSTSTTTGALVVNGGVGIGANLNVAANITATNVYANIYANNTSTIMVGLSTTATFAQSFNTQTLVATATNAAYAYSFNTNTLVTTAVSLLNTGSSQVGYATTAGFALSFNTNTLVTTAVTILNTATTQVGFATTAGYALSFNTQTLVANAVNFLNTANTQVGFATTAGYALSFNTQTLVATAVTALNATLSNTSTTQVGYATTAGFAVTFNTATLVTTATYALAFNTATLVTTATYALSFNTNTVVSNAIYAYSFNTNTLVTTAVTLANTSNFQVGFATTASSAAYAYAFNTSTLVSTAVNFLNTANTQVGYATSATTILGGSTGTLLYQSSTSTTAFLPIGANGYVLEVVNGLPAWTSIGGLSAGLATTATNIAGGVANQIPYQTAPGLTTFSNSLTFNGTTLTTTDIAITNTAAAGTSTYAAGALQVAGGVGIGGGLYVAGTITATNIIAQTLTINYTTVTQTLVTSPDIFTITNTTGVTAATGGALNVSGGVGIQGGLYVGANVTATNFYGNVYANNTSSILVGAAVNFLNTSATQVGFATTASNIAGGSISDIPYQSATGVTTFSNSLTYDGTTFTTGNIKVNGGTATTSTNTGALQVINGGVGVGGGVFVGGSVTATNFYGNVYASNTSTIQVGYATTAGFAVTFNTSTLVSTATFAYGFNTSTLVSTATYTLSFNTATLVTTATYALSFNTNTLVTTATSAGYAYSFNTATLVATAVNFLNTSNTQVGYATTAGFAVTFNTATLVTTATYALAFNTNTLVTTAVNLAGGIANQIPYQSATGATTFNSGLIFNGTVLTSTNHVVSGTAATVSTVTGALQVAGGVGVGGGLFVGGVITATNIFVGSYAVSTSTLAGNVNTVQQTGNATYYPVIVNANNASSSAESLYTTASFTVNPGTGQHVINNAGTAYSGAILSVNGGTYINAQFTATYVPASTVGVGITSQGYNTRGGSTAYDFLLATNTYGSATNPNKYFRISGSGDLQILNSTYGGILFDLTDAGSLTVVQNIPVNPSLGTASIVSGGGLYVGGGGYFTGAVTATNFTGATTQVQTTAQTGNASYYPTFVNANNASAAAETLYTTGSFVVNPGTGQILVGSNTFPTNVQTFTIASDDPTLGGAQLHITGATTSTYRLRLGYNTAGNYGNIQSVNYGVAYTPLVLNIAGTGSSPVLIGTSTQTSGEKLGVNGGTYINGILTATNIFLNGYAVSTSTSGGSASGVTVQSTITNATFYPVFVSVNTATPYALPEYTTSSFTINPSNGAVNINGNAYVNGILTATNIQVGTGVLIYNGSQLVSLSPMPSSSIRTNTTSGNIIINGGGGTINAVYLGYDPGSYGGVYFGNGANNIVAYMSTLTGFIINNGTIAYSGAQLSVNGGGYINGVLTATSVLTVGTQGSTQGSIVLANTNSTNGLTLKSSNSSSANWTLTFPTSAGSSGALLQTDGSGNTSWLSTSSAYVYRATVADTIGSGASLSNVLSIGTGLLPNGSAYNGSSPITISNGGVLSFSGGTTGLTPSSATTGTITLGGTLGVGNGGTGQNSFSSGALIYGAGSTTALNALAISGTAGAVLASSGSAPTYVTSVQATGGTGSSTGATGQSLVVTAGGLGVSGASYFLNNVGFGGNVNIAGNLYVDGTQFFVNSTNLVTGDATLTLSSGTTSAALAGNSGIQAGPVGSPYATWLYDGSAYWVSAGSNGGGIKVTSGTGSASASTGALQVSGGVGVGGGLYVGANVTATNITASGTAYTGAHVVNGTSQTSGAVLTVNGGTYVNGNFTATNIYASGTITGSISGTSGGTSASVTFNNGGGGGSSGSSFNGSSPLTVSYNTVGASPLAGSSSLTTVGTIGSGTWNGSTITGTYGGTGVNNGSYTITLGASVNLNQNLRTSDSPTFSSLTLSSPLSVANGGTGQTSLTANYIPYGNGTSAHQSSANLQFNGTTFTLGNTSAATITGIFTHGADNNFQLSSQNGTSTNASGQEVARFGVNYSGTGWDSFTQYVRGGGAQTGYQVLYAANTAMLTVTGSGISVAGTLSATTPTFTSLTGYMYANGSSAVTASTTIPGSAISGSISGGTGAALTMNNSGSGASSGTTFNGSSAVTLSYNTIGAASAGANSNITSLSGLTTALSTGQGGTGLTSFTANGIMYASSTSALATSGNLTWNGSTFYANGTLSAGSYFTAGTSVSAGYYQDATNGAYRSIVSSGTTNGYYFQTNSGASTSLYIGLGGTYNGLIGIGTLAPAQALHVVGQIIATSEITAYYSDRRLKENVKPIDNAVDKVLKLNGITYNPNELAESFGFERDIEVVGLFADEVESVLPQAVKLAPFDQQVGGESKSGENYKTVQYEKLVPLLVEAIKEQQKQIDQLKETISNMCIK